jgi:hypothetical protein
MTGARTVIAVTAHALAFRRLQEQWRGFGYRSASAASSGQGAACNRERHPMSEQRRLVFASLLFAVLWAAGMLWWESPLDTAEAIIIVIAGAVAGIFWYAAMRWWMRWMMRHRARG